MPNPLDNFSDPVRAWFQETFGAPTSPQALGWLPIQRGEHTLILAPTGSGKTLAAFLWGIDALYVDVRQQTTDDRRTAQPPNHPTTQLLYISPLKALNNDIERNLRAPLDGIRAIATRLGDNLPALRVAVRTGDTPASARAAMLKTPPHILITTPESLYLMLTSPRAREMFRTVRTVIVDEIHTLVGNKRGVHLALSLERLEHLATERVQRIGLSATIQPLEEAARFLGGQAHSHTPTLNPRPVTIVNAGYKKPLDLRVVTVVDDFSNLPGETIWPAVVPHVLNEIRQHHTTLVFANNRRLAERTADRLNAQFAAEQSEEIEPGSTEALAPGGLARDRGIFAIGAAGIFHAHHGSMSKESRRQMEEDLKAGKLPALVGTSSLELGIDIGAVDLVVQLQSPKSVARGLQRVGRSGHIVGETSVGRIYATFREDLVEAAAIARGMLEGDVEPTYTPQNPLDVLAQQIVAMVACEAWSVDALYDLVRQAYAYRDLSRETFLLVLDMLAGKYERVRAKISWDRVNNRLAALPGTRLLATMNAGTISDTGAFGVYLADNKTKVGELDEEFIFETRVGDAFLLGSHTWRVRDIKDDRIVVDDAAGALPRMPFWNGDYPWRPYELGARIGKFRREVAEKIAPSVIARSVLSGAAFFAAESKDRDEAIPKADLDAYAASQRPFATTQVIDWLQRDYALDEKSARNLVAHVQRQLEATGVLASDTTIVVESFQDAIGEPRLVIHSPFGGRVNGAWALALSSALRERFGADVETQTNDDGILFRFPQTPILPVDIVQTMTPDEARERIVRELPNSAVFGAHFRMNAARALLLPKTRGKKRTPFWLQRLKAKDLLAAVQKYDDFPIVAETYRDCLRDVFDLPHLEEILARIQSGDIRIVPIETIVPSPVAAGLLFNFVSVYMYEWDAPKAERQLQQLSLRREVLEDLLQGVELRDLLKPEAIAEVEQRAQHNASGHQARSAEELALILRDLGDLTADEIAARCAGDSAAWLAQLAAQNRIAEISIPTRRGIATRWVPAELADEYRAAFGVAKSFAEFAQAAEKILRRLLVNSAALTRDAILARYTFPESWLDETLARLLETRAIGQFPQSPNHPLTEYIDSRNLEQVHRRTLTLLRKEIQPVSIFQYADFLARWQHLHTRVAGADGLRRVMEHLRGVALPASTWERDVLPARLVDFDAADLNALCQSGDLVWVAQRSRVRFFFRGEGALFLAAPDESALSADARTIYDFLESEGASFTQDLESAFGKKPQDALVELVTAGLVTNDTMDAIRAVVETPRVETPRRVVSTALESDLAARLAGTLRALTRTRYRDAKRRVAKRLRAETPQIQLQGRWSLAHRVGVLGQPLTDDERADKLARVLLARYGIVTREALEREDICDWASLYPTFQRMEMRGEIRRGYFVAGLGGAQFALPEAVEQLRAASDDTLIVLNAADPANIYGAELPDAPRFARVPSTHVVLWRGQPVLVAEDNGERITARGEESAINRALQAYLARPNAARHVVIEQWNSESVLGSAAESLLRALGFSRTPKGMEK
ncbi:MAG: DEAD/DEAH box helicase [Chloroflexota bacterium]|nr:DEAD/DEAH box helicase [Chloroflexota bacterium]